MWGERHGKDGTDGGTAFFEFTALLEESKRLGTSERYNKTLPCALLKVFKGTLHEKMILTLSFLSPFTRRESG